MNILDIISKKRDSKELSKEEIEYFVKEYTDGNIPLYHFDMYRLSNANEATALGFEEYLWSFLVRLTLHWKW